MGRPHRCGKFSSFNPPVNLFIPHGVQEDSIGKIFLTEEEFEALKLYHYDNFKNQIVAAEKMNISQATFSRLLTKSYEKLVKALVEGLAIGIISHRGHWGWKWREEFIEIEHPEGLIPDSSQISKRNPINPKPKTEFYGYGCLNCGYEWKLPNPEEKKSQKLPCPQCKSEKTYFLIKYE